MYISPTNIALPVREKWTPAARREAARGMDASHTHNPASKEPVGAGAPPGCTGHAALAPGLALDQGKAARDRHCSPGARASRGSLDQPWLQQESLLTRNKRRHESKQEKEGEICDDGKGLGKLPHPRGQDEMKLA